MKLIKKMLSGILALSVISVMLSLPVKADVEAIVLGNSSFTWSHQSWGNNANAADGTYTKFEGAGATITATRTFSVENADEYTLEVYAASSVTNINLSNLSVKIDDGSSTVLNSSNSTVTALSDPCRTDDPWTTKNIKYNTGILLDKGTHTVTFTVPKNSNNRTEAYFVFDCAKLTQKNTVLEVSGTGTTGIGNSAFKWNHNGSRTSANAYDGTYTIFEGGGATITATKTVYVDQMAEYTLNVYAASSVTNINLSNLSVKIDDGSATVLNSSNSTVTALTNPCKTGDPWTTKDIKYNTNIMLDSGFHTITFTVPKESNNRTEAYFVFDCAKLTRKGVVVNVSNTGTTTIGNSSFLWNHSSVANSANAYDGTYTIFNGGGATITATTTVYLENAGEFILEVYGASSVTNINLSNLSVKIDDGASTVLNSSSATVTELANPCVASGTYMTKDIRCKNSVLIGAGFHTITFTVPKESNNRTEAYFVFDCAKLTEYGIEAEISDSTLAVGDSATVTVTDASGNTVDNATITSTDSDVIYVGPDRSLTAVGIGRATIIVSVRNGEGAPEHTTSLNACVGYNGIYVTSVSESAGTISAQVQLDGVTTANLNAYICVYDTNGVMTDISKAVFSGNTGTFNVSNGTEKTVLYLWRDMEPLYKETIVQ